MHVYIDDSGSFSVPTNRQPSVSCLGALIIRESNHDEVLRKFTALSDHWPKDRGEIKGRLLNEVQIAQTIELLRREGALFSCVAIDLGLHREAEISARKVSDATHLMKHITAQHHPNVIAQVKELQRRIMAVSIPEYVQVMLIVELIWSVVSLNTLYFSQTSPDDLGAFWWKIDAKLAAKRARSETLWTDLIGPRTESRSMREPIIHLVEGDYTAFKRFEGIHSDPPDHLRPFVQDWKEGEPFYYNDVNLILNEHRAFLDSKDEIGLQMADVITNAAARGMKGNLRSAGWRHLGRLMLTNPRGSEVIRLLSLANVNRRWRRDPNYYRILRHLRRTAKDPLVEKSVIYAPTGGTI